MRKIILMAVAGYLWKKFKASRTVTPVRGTATRPFPTSDTTRAARAANTY